MPAADDGAKNRHNALLVAAFGAAALIIAGSITAYTNISTSTATAQHTTSAQWQQELQDAPGELASKDVATRLQAANMLGGIITSSPQYAQSAVDLLTHFVRTEAPVKPLSVHAEPACSAIPPLADDIQSALTALGSEAAQHTRVDLSRTELARADFNSGPHLKQAKFDGADLHCTNINNADFRLASMTSADLTDIKDAKPSFAGTALTGAWVNSSRFYLNGQPKQDQVHQSMHYNCVK